MAKARQFRELAGDRLAQKALLFDFYGPLLTAKQSRIWDSYYQEDYSLAEIAAEEGISRQAVHAILKRTADNLDAYEKKLQLVARFQAGRDALQRVEHLIEGLLAESADLKDTGRLNQARLFLQQALNAY